MINEGALYVSNGKWWLLAFPALAICLVVVCLNLIAEGIRGMLRHRGETEHTPRREARWPFRATPVGPAPADSSKVNPAVPIQ